MQLRSCHCPAELERGDRPAQASVTGRRPQKADCRPGVMQTHTAWLRPQCACTCQWCPYHPHGSCKMASTRLLPSCLFKELIKEARLSDIEHNVRWLLKQNSLYHKHKRSSGVEDGKRGCMPTETRFEICHTSTM